jgi:hypothetical protein
MFQKNKRRVEVVVASLVQFLSTEVSNLPHRNDRHRVTTATRWRGIAQQPQHRRAESTYLAVGELPSYTSGLRQQQHPNQRKSFRLPSHFRLVLLGMLFSTASFGPGFHHMSTPGAPGLTGNVILQPNPQSFNGIHSVVLFLLFLRSEST